MAKEPTIGKFLDDEERALNEAIEADDGAFKSVLTPAERERHRSIAKATLDDERIQISLRISKRNLSKLKARALREGMPYQTLINSILHKAVN
jgi:predicted DNA binding CopG/RHH family protein